MPFLYVFLAFLCQLDDDLASIIDIDLTCYHSLFFKAVQCHSDPCGTHSHAIAYLTWNGLALILSNKIENVGLSPDAFLERLLPAGRLSGPHILYELICKIVVVHDIT